VQRFEFINKLNAKLLNQYKKRRFGLVVERKEKIWTSCRKENFNRRLIRTELNKTYVPVSKLSFVKKKMYTCCINNYFTTHDFLFSS
jgi:hypothetical protein